MRRLLAHADGPDSPGLPGLLSWIRLADVGALAVVAWVRLGLAGIGTLCLLSLGFLYATSLGESVALVALAALAGAVVLAVVEVAGKRPSATADIDYLPRGLPRSLGPYVFVAAATSVAMQTWFRPGQFLANGDVTPPAGTAWVARIFSAWDWSGSNLGGPSQLQRRLPWAALTSIVQGVGGSAPLAQRIWYTMLLACAGLAAVALLRTLGLGPVGSTCGALLYVFNPFVVSSVGLNVGQLAAMVLIPAYPACIVAAARGRRSIFAGAALIAVSAPFLGYVYINPPLAAAAVLTLLLSPLLAGWIFGGKAMRRGVLTLLLALPLLSLLSAYWAIPSALSLSDSTLGDLSSSSSWAWTEGRATIANAFWLNTTWGWRVPAYYPYAAAYDQPPLGVLRFVLPAVAFGALLLPGFRLRGIGARRLRLLIATAAGALFVIFLSTGSRPPGATLFNLLYNLPNGWILRRPGRFLVFAGLAYGVLAGTMIDAAVASWLARRSRGFRLDGQRIRAARALSTVMLVTVIAASLGFPLATGVVANDGTGPLAQRHVTLPGYWTRMAAYIDQVQRPGGTLVLPADDFYQMPYTWGYYGTDSFMANLMVRPVIVPTGQGYLPSNAPVIASVNEATREVVGGDWKGLVETLSRVHAPLVLVRGDIAPLPGRDIAPPSALVAGLQRAEGISLLHREGDLWLFAVDQPLSPDLTFATSAAVLTGTIDAGVHRFLPPQTNLMSGPPQAGFVRIDGLPPVEEWSESQSGLHVTSPLPNGWDYHLAMWSGGEGSLLQTPAAAKPMKVGALQMTSSGSASEPSLTMELPRRDLMSAPSLQADWGPLGNCNQIARPDSAPQLSADRSAIGGPESTPMISLAASAGSGCVHRDIPWEGGDVIVQMAVRHVKGAAPRVCIWQVGLGACAASPAAPTGADWKTYRYRVHPAPGTKALQMFLYSDTYGSPTINEYSNVAIYQAPSQSNLAVLGWPQTLSAPQRHLMIQYQAFSQSWVGPPGSTHVVVDGMFNGWVTDNEQISAPRYAPGGLVVAALATSVVSLVGVVALLVLSMGLSRQRRARLRSALQRRPAPRAPGPSHPGGKPPAPL